MSIQDLATANELRNLLRYLTPQERAEMDSLLSRTPWSLIARPEQLPPAGEWSLWLILAGRGWGKTRTGAEWFRAQAERVPLLRIIAPTFADARDTCVEGPAGLRGICAPGELVKWNRSIGEGEFRNGARFRVFSGAEPERLRGPQSYADWYDELGAWAYPLATWDMAMMGLRLGTLPQAVITTTPRPLPLFRQIVGRPDARVTRGSTYDNRANLAESFFRDIVTRYEGTRLGRQELNAELLEDVPGALWTVTTIDAGRVAVMPDMTYVAVGVDPSATSKDTSDEAGIVVAGRSADRQGYVLGDYSLRGTPLQWAREAVAAYHRHHANAIVAEGNNGGEMVTTIIKSIDPAVPVELVWAAEGKRTRAEPVSALYEQGRAHHVGTFAALEDEMTTWIPQEGRSPNRIDALAWAFDKLGLTYRGKAGF